MRRNRIVYFITTGLIMTLGLATRRYSWMLPEFLADYAGDTLWALMVFLGIGFLWPGLATRRAALAAAAFSYAIEVSQLYHAPWIDSLRFTRLGGLILGFAFLWSDVICYTVGILIGCALELLLLRSIRVSVSRGVQHV